MFAIIVGTHGLFAKELVRSCEMICGEQKNVRAVTLVPGHRDAMKITEPVDLILARAILGEQKR